MRIRPAADDDRELWDDLVRASPDSTYAHSWAWMKLYEKHLPVQPLALAGEGDGEFLAVYGGFYDRDGDPPGPRNAWKGGTFWSPHELTWDYGGPCLRGEFDLAQAETIVRAMEAAAKSAGAWSLRVSPFAPRIAAVLGKCGYEPRERLTSVVGLEGPEDRLWSHLEKSFRYDVRRAQAYGLRFETGQGASVLPTFLASIGELSSQKGFRLPPGPFFEDLLRSDDSTLRTYWHVVRDSTDVVAAVGLSLAHKGMITERWSVATDAGKGMKANHFRLWSTLCWARERGYQTYDLGGLPSDPRNGVYQFKRKVNGEIRRVDWYVRYLRFSRTAKLKRRLRKGLRGG